MALPAEDVKNALTFIQKLGSDDEFRAKLSDDPVAALRELGIEVPPGTEIPKVVTLPSKEEVAEIASWPLWLKFCPWFGPDCPFCLWE